MLKKITLFVLAVITVFLCCTSCAQHEAFVYEPGEGTEKMADSNRIDLTTFDNDMFKASFTFGNSASPELTADGVKFVATAASRDPSVFWNVNSMYEAAGFPAQSDGKTYVPFTPEQKKAIVLKPEPAFVRSVNQDSPCPGCPIRNIPGRQR